MEFNLIRVSSGFINIPDRIILESNYTGSISARPGSGSDACYHFDIPGAEIFSLEPIADVCIKIYGIRFIPISISKSGTLTVAPLCEDDDDEEHPIRYRFKGAQIW